MVEGDKQALEDLAAFVREKLVPAVAKEFVRDEIPINGTEINNRLRSYGLHQRYLGHIREAIDPAQVFIRKLVSSQMITVAAAHVYDILIRDVPLHGTAEATAYFLNVLFGKPNTVQKSLGALQKSIVDAVVNRAASGSTTPETVARKDVVTLATISPKRLWKLIEARVEAYFGFPAFESLGDGGKAEARATWGMGLSTLRSLCTLIGVQISGQAKLNLSSDMPFKTRHILDLFPVVNHNAPGTGDGDRFLAIGKALLNQGAPAQAHAHMTQALVMYEKQLGTLLHSSVASAMSNLAITCMIQKDAEAAVKFARNAVVIAERTTGLDSPLTISAYKSLGTVYKMVQNPSLALACFVRARTLLKLTSAIPSLESVHLHGSIGDVLPKQDPRLAALAFQMYEVQMNIIQKLQLPQSLLIKPLTSAADLRLAFNDFDAAIHCERAAFKIIKSIEGEDSPAAKQKYEKIRAMVVASLEASKAKATTTTESATAE